MEIEPSGASECTFRASLGKHLGKFQAHLVVFLDLRFGHIGVHLDVDDLEEPGHVGFDGLEFGMGGGSSTIPLLTLNYSNAAALPVALPTALRPIAPLGTPAAYKHLVLSSGMGIGMMGGGMMQFLIDGKSFDMSRVDLTSRVNEIEEWTVENRSSMDHPFHLHGTQFQVMRRTRGGATLAEPMLAWRDVVNVAAFETVTFRVVQSQLGKRMYHCHILEHEDQGMMGVLEVVP